MIPDSILHRFAITAFLCAALWTGAGAEGSTGFTSAQKQWLEDNPVIRYAIDPAWPPFSSLDAQGRHIGIDADLLGRLEAILGVQFELVPTSGWVEAEQLLKEGGVHFVPAVAHSDERAGLYQFTQPYLLPTVVMINRANGPFAVPPYHLGRAVVALPSGYIQTWAIQADYPDATFLLTDTPLEALQMVAAGRVDLTVENLATAGYLIRTHGLGNLKIAGVLDYEFALRIAVSNEHPLLKDILDSALDRVSEAEFHEFLSRWIYSELHFLGSWHVIIRWVGIALAIFFVLLASMWFWNRRLSVELRRRQAAEQALAAANTHLAALNSDKDTFLTMAAHDLGNPLTQIKMSCEILESRVGEEENLKMINRMKAASDRMSRLVKSLLYLHRLDCNSDTSHRESFDPAKLVAKTVSEFEYQAAEKKIRFTLEAPSGRCCLLFQDPLLFEQIIVNLISNALKFTPEHGVVRVCISDDGSFLCVTVSDSGPGLTPVEVTRIFVPYAGISNRPTAGELSIGVGLSIVKRLTEHMGGSIAVSQGDLGGACFDVRLPLTGQSPP